MGINVGDVVVTSDGHLLGDGVNIAARIQTTGEPGGICSSGSVYDQIQNKLSLQLRPLGERNFKNMGQSVRTYTIAQGETGELPILRRSRAVGGPATRTPALEPYRGGDTVGPPTRRRGTC